MLHYFILGIIEGLTEFLPISSTAHLILYNYISGFNLSLPFIKVFNISVQLGAILAVIFYYHKDFMNIKMLKLLAIGVLPTLLLGFILKDYVVLLMEHVWLIALNLIIGGVIMLIAEKYYAKRQSDKVSAIDYKSAATFGLVQSIAMMPGVSRSAAVIVYGLFKNYDREILTKFTFLLAVPTMLAATTYSIYKYKDSIAGASFDYLVIGFMTSFIVALIVVRYAIPFIKTYTFAPFAFYRIILGLIILITL